MIRDLTVRAVYMGILAAFVGYAASVTIVLSGIIALGATSAQAATGLFFATLGMGICSIWLPALTRTPAAVAWSTPGAAFLASTAMLPGGFAEGAGALVCCAVLLLMTGLVPALGRVVAAIPKPIANALLAGVLLKLCFAPALALGSIPTLVLPVLLAWLVGLCWHRLAAMPFAVIAFVAVLYFSVDLSQGLAQAGGIWMPSLAPVVPQFSWQSVISVALPLYLVTMAGQNIPGFAVLELNGYPVDKSQLIKKTGFVSLLVAPFGSIPVNMSAIIAAMVAGEDAGSNPRVRYWSAITTGIVYIALAFISALVVALAASAPTELIAAVAGLALYPALAGSISAAFSNTEQLEAPAMTFLITASGVVLFSVSGAFWGIVAGVLIWYAKQLKIGDTKTR